MAIKGVVVIQNLGYVGADQARLDVSFCSTVASPQVDSGISVTVATSDTPAQIEAAVKAAVQAELETAGVSFTPAVDSVMLVGATL